jgi:cellulose synthase/poly-beta-1,6-N-acetylglucosamine synthase-like glycosyltransferase
MTRIDVCVCTHDPRRDVLAVALRAIAAQTLARTEFAVVVVDNATAPALADAELAPLRAADIAHRLIREPRLGNAFARARALRDTTAPIAVFVDDDNELAPDYLARAVAAFEADDRLGCIGGRIVRAPGVVVPRWLEPLRAFIGLRDDLGDAAITEVVRAGRSPAVPPTAGMALRRELAAQYVALVDADGGAALAGIGRVGRTTLGSCEDLLLARLAHRRELACGYRPELVLYHHLDPRRFALGYLVRFMFGQGASEARVDRLLGWRRGAADWRRAHVARDPRVALLLAARAAGRRYATR